MDNASSDWFESSHTCRLVIATTTILPRYGTINHRDHVPRGFSSSQLLSHTTVDFGDVKYIFSAAGLCAPQEVVESP
jgi:hypothetical protein